MNTSCDHAGDKGSYRVRSFPPLPRKWAIMAAGILALTPSIDPASGSSCSSIESLIASAPAIVIAHATKVGCYEAQPQGKIRTRWQVTIDRTLKGTVPSRIMLDTDGGDLPGNGSRIGCAPRIEGTTGIFLLEQNADGSIGIHGGIAGMMTLDASEFPDQARRHALLVKQISDRYPDPAVFGQDLTFLPMPPAPAAVMYLLTNSAGIPSRFIACDRGEPIHYVVDAGVRPAGLSTAQVMSAISNAFSAWRNVSSLSFVHDGYETFVAPPDVVTNRDRRIWIQTGDPFLQTYSGILGYGGRNYSWSWDWANGGEGGQVAGNEFFESTIGYVIMRSQDPAIANLKTFEEVMCHEIGHVLGLAHTSENASEANAALYQAQMYYKVHQDGRGASLHTTDVAMVRQVHPANTPPFGFKRQLAVITANPPPADLLANSFSPRGYDLQTNALTMTLTNNTGWAGMFAMTNGVIRYTALAVWNDSTGSYDSVDMRWSDGVNASPPAQALVTSFSRDRVTPSDGIPDNWMSNYFGHADAQAADLSRPGDDPDNDGLTNIEEYRTGFNPLISTSCLAVISMSEAAVTFVARQDDLYELQRAWIATGPYQAMHMPVTATGSSKSVSFPGTTNAALYRIHRIH